ncbi:hypothetical protein BH11PSE4_BH11PSE4_25840 [soil metagenome]
MRLRPTYRRPGHAAIHPALNSFADEAQRTIVHLVAYMGVLALLVTAAVHLFGGFDLPDAAEPAAKAGWSVASRSYPAFAVSQFDSAGATESYEILRHPDGGRKDVLRWAAAGEKPLAELELYRPGQEAATLGPPVAGIAARMDPDATREIAGEGIVDSKFGPVALFGFADRAGGSQRCLGFMKRLDAANFRISGFSCQGDNLPARRAAIACTLNRLVLLTAGNDPKLQEIFAHAELKRGDCASGSALTANSADWVTGAQNPFLRGSL